MLDYRNRREDILQDESHTLVIPVNCQGVMGKGLSYRIAMQNEDDFIAYQRACADHVLKPGGMFVYESEERRIVHLAVQDDWRDRARLSDVSSALEAFRKAYPHDSCAIAGDMCYSSLLWKDVNRVLQYCFGKEERICTVYPPLKDDKGMSRLKITAEGLCLLQDKMMLKKFNGVRLQMMCFFMNVYLGREHYPFIRGSDGPVSLLVKREAERVKYDMNSFHIRDAAQAVDLFYRVLCSKDTDRLMSMNEKAGGKAAVFVNGIEDDLVLAGCGMVLYLLKHGYSADTSGMILKMRGWSDDSPFALCENRVYQMMFDALKRARLIETDMFGQIRLTR
ncbi:MAG: hypothetical protein SOI52_02190 [Erysipelotrichaceae bacterium]|jgi:hypothetical protein